jgi:hypothetical protein
LLLALCEEIAKLMDNPDLANSAGPATTRLSNALLDYRDSRGLDR